MTMNLHSLFSHAHSDTFRHVQEKFEIPLSTTQPSNPASYDLCLVIPLLRKEMSMEMVHTLERIISTCGRKYVYMYNAPDDTHRFVLLRGGSTRLRSKAEQIGAKLQLDGKQCLITAQEGNLKANIAPIKIAHQPHITPIKPFEFIYAKYICRDDKIENLYRTVSDTGSALFQKVDRIHLLDRVINDSESDGGADAKVKQLLSDGSILGYFPLHSAKDEGEYSLSESITSYVVPPWRMPLDEVNEYFGQQISFYLAFMCNVVTWLIVPAVVGTAFQISAVALHNYSRPEIPVFAFAISLWAVGFHEHWKRQEKRYGMRWNALTPPEDTVRLDFNGVHLENSYIDGKPMIYYRPDSYLRSAALTLMATAAICLATIGVIAAIYVVRWLLYNTPVGRFNQFVSSGLNAVSIVVLNAVFRYLGKLLVEAENHRTTREYNDSLAIKTIIFTFVNNFTSFYYLAFGAKFLPQGGNQQSVGMCGYNDCMVALSINLAAIFGIRLVFGMVFTRAVPILYHVYQNGMCTCKGAFYCFRRLGLSCYYRLFRCQRYLREDDDDGEMAYDEAYKEEHPDRLDQSNEESKQGSVRVSRRDRKLEDMGFTRAEWEFHQPDFNDYSMTFRMADQMITFGHMTLFVAALPGAPALGLLYYLVNINSDGWMLFNYFRRPWPTYADGIGHYWHACLRLMVILTVMTNAALVVFTMQTLDASVTLDVKLAIFIGFQYVVFSIQYLIQTFLPATPSDVSIQLARQEFIVKKLIDRVPDEHAVGPSGELKTPLEVL